MPRGKSKSRSKSRMSLTGILAYLIAPLGTFMFGVPGISNGAFRKRSGGNLNDKSFSNRLMQGFNALSSAYFGFSFLQGKFVPKALLQGYLPVLGNVIIRKTGVNRRVPDSSPLLL